MSVQMRIYRLPLLFKELSGKNRYLVSREANASRRKDCCLNIWISFYSLTFSSKAHPGKIDVVFLYKEYAFYILAVNKWKLSQLFVYLLSLSCPFWRRHHIQVP